MDQKQQTNNQFEVRDYDAVLEQFRTNPLGVMNDASSRGMNVAQHLNNISPQTLIEQKRNITNRLMEDLGFTPKDSSFTKATTYEEFAQTEAGRAIAYDYLYRNHIVQAREVPKLPSSYVEAVYPPTEGPMVQETNLAPRFNPATLVGLESTATSSVYKPIRFEPKEEDLKRERVAPGTNLPTMQAQESDSAVNLYKWGIAAELTYESIRRQSLDVIGAMLRAENDVEGKRVLSEMIDKLINGDDRDGQTNSAGVTLNTKAKAETRSGLNGGNTAGELNLKGIMTLLSRFTPHNLTCNYFITRASVAIDLALTTLGSSDIPLAFLTQVSAPGIPGFSIPGIGGRVTVLIASDDDIAANQIVAIDSTRALERITEVGSEIREQARDIRNQTEVMTFSNNYGFAKWYLEATRNVNLA